MRHARHLVALTQAAPQSLTCFEHDQSLKQGTPFSVTPDEVARLYGAVCGVTAVARRPTLGRFARQARAG